MVCAEASRVLRTLSSRRFWKPPRKASVAWWVPQMELSSRYTSAMSTGFLEGWRWLEEDEGSYMAGRVNRSW